ncbi:hypothetical protein [Bdellovibrio bacteriovorus]
MTDLHDVAMFCLFYSGVVMYALWITVARKPVRAEAKQKKF